jgi:hypothetical protein
MVDPATALRKMIEETLKGADFLKVFQQRGRAALPCFSRPVVIVDGLHQLFDVPHTNKIVETSLKSLVESCRALGAVFIFSFSSESTELKRLEYLCDLIIELERTGFANPADKPRRYFQLAKARRQPARIGSHVFHLKGDSGFRLKPSIDARVQEAKSELWWEPDPRAEIFLTDDPPPGFYGSRTGRNQARDLPIRNRGQVLVLGKGSSGKAGFGLYLLHRRWFDRRMFVSEGDFGQFSLLSDDAARGPRHLDLSMRKRVVADAELPINYDASLLETRVLVISFLYQRGYYDDLTARLASKRRGKVDRRQARYGPVDGISGFDFTPLPDRMRTDTIELYPGMLGTEDFIAKVDKRLLAAEGAGLPYTGVLVDGLHNVFVQFPALERESSFWGMFYNVLRRRRVTVVTTHTEFDIHGQVASKSLHEQPRQQLMTYDFEQAHRKIAPLLSAMVSGADYLFELSPLLEGRRVTYSLIPRGSIGYDVGSFGYRWDKAKLRLETGSST